MTARLLGWFGLIVGGVGVIINAWSVHQSGLVASALGMGIGLITLMLTDKSRQPDA